MTVGQFSDGSWSRNEADGLDALDWTGGKFFDGSWS